MAESRRYGPGAAQLGESSGNIEQILSEAQHRWLRPAEICEILQNYKKFRIASVPAHKPPGGSLFLFDRKVLRYFRKDGHNWRKKKDGKTVKEAHEKLKAGSIDVLHCYYAHGEENENFQRRSYWMLEEELSNIVLVHYREVKGNRTNFNRMNSADKIIPISQETEETIFSSEVDSSVSSKFQRDNYQVNSQTTDTTSLNSGIASEYEDAESAYYHQASPSLYSSLELQQFGLQKIDDGLSVPYYPVHFSNDFQVKLSAGTPVFVSQSQGEKDVSCTTAGLTHEPLKHLNPPCDGLLENFTAGVQSVTFQPSLYSTQSQFGSTGGIPGQGSELLGQVLIDGFDKKQELVGNLHGQEEWQTSEGASSHMSKWPVDQKLHPDLANALKENVNGVNLLNSLEPCHKYPTIQNKHPVQNDLQIQPSNVEGGSSPKSDLESNFIRGAANYSSVRHPLLDGFQREGLKKLDSFDRWMSKELGDVSDSDIHSSSEPYWETVGCEHVAGDSGIAPQMHLDTYMLPPSLSQDQLFSIIDFSPNWAYAGSEIKVLITGRFLKSQQDVEKCNWSCMFGELEVPAEVVADGVLGCHTPLHQVGRVPFYVSCSNRLACSEVREFEYRANNIQDVDVACINIGSTSEIVCRFGRLLSLGSISSSYSASSSVVENFHLSSQITSFIKEDENEWYQMLELASENGSSLEEMKEQLVQKLLKENLLAWLHQKTAEGGKGPGVLDEDGQGVLHFAAALGYDWAIPPTIDAGVSVNFRDVNGWTALHWAASCGRESMVALLVFLGAAPGALTDPTPIYPSGRTPADLASSNGHKGIAGYLAESALSCHLSSLKLKDNEGDAGEISGVKFVHTGLKPVATSINDGDITHGQSLKDSLAAVCNATQAAAQIHQIFRVQSFQKKLLKECEDDKFGISDERALSLVVVKKNRLGQHDEPVRAAAIRIQNKFRSWKGRREYLTIRQQVVKIQAHVRGHQVRKNYKTITWSVGILEKVILRWRRKGSGLRGFKSEALTVGSMHDMSLREDDPDFLKESRKQKEEGLQKALARVKSMVQYPEARDQYRRLLHVVGQIQETKDVYSGATISSEGTAEFDDLIDLEELLDVDTIMSPAL